MDDLVKIWEKPTADEIYMIAGWQQWADAGSISSGLPEYLIQLTKAHKIGEIEDDGFYLFQIPGTHHFLRPEIKLDEGYRKELSRPTNEIYYTETSGKGLLIFMGSEPHMRADRYAEALLNAVDALGVQRVVAIGGVYGAMPYEKERDISCVYSLKDMKDDLERYAVRFSNYEGGTTIGTYLVDRAEHKDIEFLVMYAFVPAYDFAELSSLVQGIRVENDFKAWYELLLRLNHMFGIDIDLSDLEDRSDELVRSMEAKIAELDDKLPQHNVTEYLERLTSDFVERPFSPPLSDVWERGLSDLFGDSDPFDDED
jgi:proteasome assembly chaperone (PAC2) family protein